jgi:hypothetical protein
VNCGINAILGTGTVLKTPFIIGIPEGKPDSQEFTECKPNDLMTLTASKTDSSWSGELNYRQFPQAEKTHGPYW